MTIKGHSIAQILMVVLHGLNLYGGLVPVKYQPVVAFLIAVVQASLALYNHYFTPQGLKIVALLLLCLFAPLISSAQTNVAPVQHFVMSTTAGSYGGSPVSILSTGTQLTSSVSVVYEYIVNPADSSKPRVGSGVANYTFQASRVLPSSLKKNLLIDFSNYNITLQAGAGRESLSNGIGAPRTTHIVGNFGLYGSYPLPGGHTQIGLGYKFILGPQGGLVKVPAGTLNFTF